MLSETSREANPARAGAGRLLLPALALGAGVLALVVSFFCTPLSEDEVFWLAGAWADRHGAPTGQLPLRVWLFLPFLTAGTTPSGAVLAGRAATLLAAFVCAGLVWSISRRMGHPPAARALMAAALMLWMSEMPLVYLRAEHFAFLFLAGGLWALLAPPAGWPPRRALVVAFALIGLAAGTSVRQVLLPLGALGAVMADPGPLGRRRAAAWALAGTALGAAPSLLLFAASHESLRHLYYWSVTFPTRAYKLRWGTGFVDAPGEVLALLGLSLAACATGVLRRRPHVRRLAVLWAMLAAQILVSPLSYFYTFGPWLAVALLACGGLATQKPARRFLVPALLVLCVLPLVRLGIRARPSAVTSAGRDFAAQLRLVDWLARTAAGRPVMCVSPYHPIRAENAWPMWNRWSLRIRRPGVLREMRPALLAEFAACRPAVIDWEPIGGVNVLRYFTGTGVMSDAEADGIARRLAERYTAVRWPDPLPDALALGPSIFLVRRDLRIPPGAVPAEVGMVFDWRRPAPHPFWQTGQ